MNQPDFLGKCLESLHNQIGFDGKATIVVVDNGSHEMPTSICEKWKDVTLLQELTPGPGPARNLGATIAKSDILAFIDADCMAESGWLNAIETAFRNPEIQVIGGDVQVPYGDPQNPTALEAYERIYAYRNKEYVASGYSGTGNLSMRSEILAKVGPFGGIGIAEDKDWGLRAVALGIRTHYVTDMIIYHPARKKIEEMKRKWDRHIAHDFANVLTFTEKLRWVFRAILIGASPIVEFPHVVTTDRVSGMRVRLMAFFCLSRIRLYRFRRMLSVWLVGNGRSLSGAWNRD